VSEYLDYPFFGKENGTITITDMVGKEIASKQFSEGQLILLFDNSIATGNYFVNLFDDEGKLMAVKKFIKQ